MIVEREINVAERPARALSPLTGRSGTLPGSGIGIAHERSSEYLANLYLIIGVAPVGGTPRPLFGPLEPPVESPVAVDHSLHIGYEVSGQAEGNGEGAAVRCRDGERSPGWRLISIGASRSGSPAVPPGVCLIHIDLSPIRLRGLALEQGAIRVPVDDVVDDVNTAAEDQIISNRGKGKPLSDRRRRGCGQVGGRNSSLGRDVYGESSRKCCDPQGGEHYSVKSEEKHRLQSSTAVDLS